MSADVQPGPGERIRRLRRRRRLLREEMLAVAVLLLVLAATVAVLAAQWLGSGPSAAAAPSRGAAGVHWQMLRGGNT
ncbi:MAG TPA: hypothetical protein VKU88_00675 [Acidimicrobiales bacterium]|nr:hypothetical protein [Acidimicrobiales bacterium]